MLVNKALLAREYMIENKNKHLTDEFEKILEFHNNEGNKFEALAYRKVIGILKKYKEEINSGKAVISTSPKGANLRELKQFFR